eukprot:CAMPEP_0181455652 /NCGR_PEP_ID=MMETSP1110-20121109/30867_1 /TAXON_ID=174948 /ORGANISM="Symbiodinium sp., Strain CCMP421" /LENGTH=81 /DNA_ID=CAMNT_0023580041 /DNA_START=588 /DNA_END=834 /DNA_ORIENTATION=+
MPSRNMIQPKASSKTVSIAPAMSMATIATSALRQSRTSATSRDIAGREFLEAEVPNASSTLAIPASQTWSCCHGFFGWRAI